MRLERKNMPPPTLRRNGTFKKHLKNNSPLIVGFSCRVDYVDSFGRTRRCLKKDLTVFQKQDAELNKQPLASTTSVSYGNFVAASVQVSNEEPSILSLDEEARKRQRQLWEEEEEKNRDKSKVHYQDILYQGRIIPIYFFMENKNKQIQKLIFKN